MKIKTKIEQHSLWEFLKDVQEAIQKGYVLDLDTNENFPQSYGSYYSVTLVKDQADVQESQIVVDANEAITEVEKAIASIAPKKPRKAKVAEIVEPPDVGTPE